MNEMTMPAIKGEEHWTTKGGDVKLLLVEKCAGDPKSSAGTILFVHGSSMASQPTFDLQTPDRPDSGRGNSAVLTAPAADRAQAPGR